MALKQVLEHKDKTESTRTVPNSYMYANSYQQPGIHNFNSLQDMITSLGWFSSMTHTSQK